MGLRVGPSFSEGEHTMKQRSAVTVACEASAVYEPLRGALSDQEVSIVVEALAILESYLQGTSWKVTSTKALKDYLTLKLALLECEVFGALWLDAQCRVINSEELFRGTLTKAAVESREVVKHALNHNAAFAVIYHNHPSRGSCDPSPDDIKLTKHLKKVLALVNVTLLDHLIVSGAQVASLLERRLI
jgi:DNA repair protein RadC